MATALICLLTGCAAGKPERAAYWAGKIRPFQGPTGGDVVVMDVYQVERPVGDRFLNQEVWGLADEQGVSLERKSALEDNGFRVGQVGGMMPAELQELLGSERSCPDPRRRQLRAEHATTVKIGPAVPQCRFQLSLDGQAAPVTCARAECALVVVPSLTSDGRTCLHFTPQVQHGTAALLPRPAADRSGWELCEQRPTESYEALSWDVVLATGEYALVGGRYDRPETLGHQCFIRKDDQPVQRLLVLRTARSPAGVESP